LGTDVEATPREEWSPMTHFVRLDRLPDHLEFPAEMETRICYDPARRGLVHHGPMSKREFDLLWSLSDCREYRRALEELFRLATWEAETQLPRGRRFRWALALGILALSVAAALVLCSACGW
jgi:hypothetical protein